ncbi:MAG: hypothetical protein ACR2OM_01870 [Aestuariivirgaceae bacterium]
MDIKDGWLSEPQLEALRSLAEQEMYQFRRGFASTKLGPFYSRATVCALVRRDLVQLQRNCKVAKLTENGWNCLKFMNERRGPGHDCHEAGKEQTLP